MINRRAPLLADLYWEQIDRLGACPAQGRVGRASWTDELATLLCHRWRAVYRSHAEGRGGGHGGACRDCTSAARAFVEHLADTLRRAARV